MKQILPGLWEIDEIGDTVVRHENDRAVRIKDVANVAWDIEPMRGDAATNGHLGVILSVKKSPGFDTLDLTDRVDQGGRVLSVGLLVFKLDANARISLSCIGKLPDIVAAQEPDH